MSAGHVLVTFNLDPSDEDDRTGLTSDQYEKVTDALRELGAYDVEIEHIPGDIELVVVPQRPKPERPKRRSAEL